LFDLGVLAYDYGTELWAEHNSDESTSEPAVETADATHVSPSPPSTAPYQPTTMPSIVSVASSASSLAGPTPTDGVDLTSLFGMDERPDNFHLEAGQSSLSSMVFGVELTASKCDRPGRQRLWYVMRLLLYLESPPVVLRLSVKS
jgi:hypothetical protein